MSTKRGYDCAKDTPRENAPRVEATRHEVSFHHISSDRLPSTSSGVEAYHGRIQDHAAIDFHNTAISEHHDRQHRRSHNPEPLMLAIQTDDPDTTHSAPSNKTEKPVL